MPRPTADTGFAAGETGRSGVSGAAARTLLAAVARQAAGRRQGPDSGPGHRAGCPPLGGPVPGALALLCAGAS